MSLRSFVSLFQWRSVYYVANLPLLAAVLNRQYMRKGQGKVKGKGKGKGKGKANGKGKGKGRGNSKEKGYAYSHCC